MKNVIPRRSRVAGVLLAGLLAAAGCSSSSAGPTGSSAGPAASSSNTAEFRAGTSPATASAAGSAKTSTAASAASPRPAGGAVTLVTHDSFAVDKKVLAAFEKSSGVTVTLLAQGDAGALVNKLVLTKDNPLGDAVFGIDNTFASRALEAGILQPYTSPEAGNGSDKYSVGGDNRLSAVDYGDVCINVDHAWFTSHHLKEPVSYEDLAQPAYQNLLVVESPATSSPGLAFLLGTIDHFGADKWADYWTALKNNGVKVTAGWTDAYSVDFSGSSGKGARPLVVSYASSPPDEVRNGVAPTGALLNTCFRQVEYAGVLTGAKNPTGARQVVDFLLSQQFQAGVAEQMYVYPVDRTTALPADWQKFAPVAPHPATMDPAEIAAQRESWISRWSDLIEG